MKSTTQHRFLALCLSLLVLAARAFCHEPEARETVVLARFPTEPAALLPDVAELAPKLIDRHGLEEWKATVLTSELHRHLGTYSIIGAKMGIRARELFDAGMDELSVVTKAGGHPPLSCLCDGLQVATGASLGRGSITVIQDSAPAAEAIFVHDGKKLRLSLKDGIAKRIAGELRELQSRHGGLGKEYFREVRTSSLRAWLELSRKEIFDEHWLAPAGQTGRK